LLIFFVRGILCRKPNKERTSLCNAGLPKLLLLLASSWSKSRHLPGRAGDVPLDALLLLSSVSNNKACDGLLLIDPLLRQGGLSALASSRVCFFADLVCNPSFVFVT
jgi:hypothetical protein